MTGLTANTLYYLYVTLVGGIPALSISTALNSVGPGAALWKLVGAFYAASATTLGSFVSVVGSPVAGWLQSVPVYSNSGSTSLSAISLRRVGDTLQLQGRSVFSSAGAAAVLRLRIPSSMGTIDIAKVQTGGSAGTVGNYLAQIAGVIYNGSVGLTTTANEVSFTPDGAGGPHLGSALGGGPPQTELSYILSVPIIGWSNTPLKDL
jgi:hypothetical protein